MNAILAPFRGARAAGALAVVTVSAVAYVADPKGLGGVLFVITAGVCILGITLGPLSRGVEARLWGSATAGGVFFLLGLVSRLVPLPDLGGPLAWADLFCFLGYACLAFWLAGLLRRIGEPVSGNTVLDTALIAVGTSLALWTVTISPALLTGDDIGSALVSAAYPVLDVVLVTLSAQLVFRTRARVPAMWAFLVGLVILQGVDTAYTFVWAVEPDANVPALTACFLYAYLCFAIGMCHPSLLTLMTRPQQPRATRRPSHRGAMLLFMVSPGVLSIVYPMNGAVDATVRAAMITTLFLMIFLRLSSTMSSLADAEAESRFRALHDSLTGLPNRASFAEHLERRLHGSGRGHWLCVLFIDCDNFKHVNDTWGHPTGDTMLSEVATRLRRSVRDDDVLARLGGDEFVILASRDHPQAAQELAAAVMSAFASPMQIMPGHRLTMTASIGISVGRPGMGHDQESFFRQADIALYAAKARGRAGWAVFDESLRLEADRQLGLVDDLGEAVRAGQLSVHFQPIVGGPQFRTVVGWEALARWNHPVQGPISPELFIPIAEQSGLIRELGAFVLDRACSHLSRIRAESGRDDLRVSVNISPVQLAQPELPAVLSATLAAHRLPHDALWLEVTESTIVQRGSAMAAVLNDLQRLGIPICVDDFGTGYSSLATLQALPVDFVKLDRLFVAGIVSDPRARAVTTTIVAMMDALNVRGLVAEGVETPDQAAVLAGMGCAMAQGYLFGRPQPAELVHLHSRSGAAYEVAYEEAAAG